MPASALYLSDMGGFPRAGEPVLVHPSGNVFISGIPPSASISAGYLYTNAGDRVVYYGNNVPGGGVRHIIENTSVGIASYAGLSNYVDGAYASFFHTTTSGYNQGAIIYVASTTYLGGLQSGGLHLIAGHASGVMRFTVGGEATTDERMRITSAGDIGIGVTGPSYKVHVQGTVSGAVRSVVTNLSTASTGYAGLGVQNSAASFYMEKLSTGYSTSGLIVASAALLYTSSGLMLVYTTTSNPIVFATAGSGTSNERMRIDGGGNVSIGALNTTPSDRLHVYSTANARNTIRVEAANGSAAYSGVFLHIGAPQAGGMSATGSSWAALGIYLASQTNFISSQSAGMNILSEHASGVIRFATGGSATTNERMQITASGLVNIGEPQTPVELLHLYQTTNAQVALRIETTSTGTTARASARFYTSTGTLTGVIFATSSGWTTTATHDVASMLYMGAQGTGGIALVAENASGKIVLVTGGTTAERLTLSSAGNVVVGSAALATTATDGYFYITSCAGAPTGVPTAFTGRKALQWDSTNSKLYVYEGGWVAMN